MVVSEQPTQHFSPELGLGTVVNATDVVDALTVGGLLDLGPTSTYYVGANGCGTVGTPGLRRGTGRRRRRRGPQALRRRKRREGADTLLLGHRLPRWRIPNEPGPGPKMGILGVAEGFCCVPPWTGHMLAFSPIFLSAFLYNTLCSKHKDMEFPPWAGAALVMTDKGVIGRRHFGPDSEINAISWGGFDVDRNVRIRSYDTCRCTSGPDYCDPIPQFLGPAGLWTVLWLVVPCCRCICIQPKEPGLYRATIFSKHTTTVWTGRDRSVEIPTGSIDLLALARSPEELRSSLRALKERYLDSLPRLR